MFQLPESWNITKRIAEMRNESFESWADKQPLYRSKYKSQQARSDNVVRVLSFPEFSPSGKQEIGRAHV